MEKKNKTIIAILSILVVVLVAAVIYLLFFNNKDKEPIGNDNLPVDNSGNNETVDNNQTDDTNQVNNNEGNNQTTGDKLYHIEDGEEFTIYGAEYDETSSEFKEYKERDIKISFDYPVIDVDSDEVKAINKEIADQYKEDYDLNLRTVYDGTNNGYCVAIKKDGNFYAFHHVFYDSYDVYENDNYLSLVVTKHSYTECAGGSGQYKGYVIDKTTKKVMTNAEVIKMFNASEKVIFDSYNDKAIEKAETIEDMEIFIFKGNLAVAIPGNGDALYKYNNGQLEEIVY